MKHLILTAVTVSGFTLFAGSNVKAQSDSAKINHNQNEKTDTAKYKTIIKIISVENGDVKIGAVRKDSLETAYESRFIGGITFARFDLGFSRLIDNGNFSLSSDNQFLDYNGGKTHQVSFDLVQFGYRFNNHFKLFLSGGIDWMHIRLNNNITMQKNAPKLTYVKEEISFSKNRFSGSYAHFPLNFEFRIGENEKKRFYFIASPEISFLLSGKVKQVSIQHGKVKVKGNYNFAPFRYGGALRFGYNSIGLFAKYYANDMFTGKPQAGLKNMAFGITFCLH